MEWYPIPDTPNYRINKLGQVKSTRKILKPFSCRAGYQRVALYINSRHQKKLVHRLVAQTFIPNPFNLKQVNHINGIKTDNRVENLEWMTHQENSAHAKKLGLIANGESQGSSKLKSDNIKYILNTSVSAIELAKQFNVHFSTIYRIRQRQSWKHISL